MASRGSADELLTTAEAAVLLRKSTGTLVNWRYLSKNSDLIGPAWTRVGGRGVLYRRSVIDAYLTAETVAA